MFGKCIKREVLKKAVAYGCRKRLKTVGNKAYFRFFLCIAASDISLTLVPSGKSLSASF